MVASGGPPPRATSFIPVGGRLLLLRWALLTLYTSICYAVALCTTVDTNGRDPGVLAELSPLAIFDQYYKNQPTDFLRKISPPCVAEYFIGVHPERTLDRFLLFHPVFARGQRARKGRENRWRERHAISFRFVACDQHSWNAIFQWGTFLRSIWNPFATHAT